MKYFIRVINNMGWVMWIPLAAGVGGLAVAILFAPFIGIPFGLFFVFIFWKLMFGPMVKDERLRDIGIEAEAKVISIQENGSSLQMGGQLPKPGMAIRLEVHPTGREPFITSTNAYISMFEMEKYQPGSTIRVKFDPAKPQSLVMLQSVPTTGYYSSGNTHGIQATEDMTEAQTQELIAKIERLKKDQQDLLEKGIQYNALVTSFTDMNIPTPLGGTLVTMKVDVQGPSGSYPAEFMAPVIKAGMGKYQEGKTVFVRVDKNNPNRVALAGSPENKERQSVSL